MLNAEYVFRRLSFTRVHTHHTIPYRIDSNGAGLAQSAAYVLFSVDWLRFDAPFASHVRSTCKLELSNCNHILHLIFCDFNFLKWVYRGVQCVHRPSAQQCNNTHSCKCNNRINFISGSWNSIVLRDPSGCSIDQVWIRVTFGGISSSIVSFLVRCRLDVIYLVNVRSH